MPAFHKLRMLKTKHSIITGLSCRTTFILTEADNILAGSESQPSEMIETFIVSFTDMIALFKHVKKF